MTTDGLDDSIYVDTGCYLHPSCLSCPEIICVMDWPGGVRSFRRYMDMYALRRQGISEDVIARRYQVTRRSVQRILAKHIPAELEAYLNALR